MSLVSVLYSSVLLQCKAWSRVAVDSRGVGMKMHNLWSQNDIQQYFTLH